MAILYPNFLVSKSAHLLSVEKESFLSSTFPPHGGQEAQNGSLKHGNTPRDTGMCVLRSVELIRSSLAHKC